MFNNKFDLKILSELKEEILQAPAHQEFIEIFKEEKTAQEVLFMLSVRLFLYSGTFTEEAKYDHAIRENNSLPDVVEAKKKKELLQKKFAYTNLNQLFNEPIAKQRELKLYHEKLFPFFAQKWIFDKYIEIQSAMLVLAGLSLKKAVDYSSVLKIDDDTEGGSRVVLEFLIDYSKLKWKLNGYKVDNRHSVNLYVDSFDVRMNDYFNASLIK